MADEPISALDKMLSIREEIEARLLETDDYRALIAINQAIAVMGGASPVSNGERSPLPILPKPKRAEAVSVGDLSQADAAQVLLTKVLYEPVVIAKLVTALVAHGVAVGGANPNINLSSVLSKDGRFRSVRYKDKSCWWVKGTPFPGELDAS